MRCLLAATAAISLTATSVSAQDRVELEPASDWVMNYDDDSCALHRSFTNDEDTVYFEMRAYEPGPRVELAIASDTLRRTRRQPETMWVPDDESRRHADAQLIAFAEGYEGVIFQTFLEPQSFLQQFEDREGGDPPPVYSEEDRAVRERAITGLAFDRTFNEDVLLRTGEMHQPMEAMRACLDELLTHWGLDLEAHRSLQRPAIPQEMGRWASEIRQSYPPQGNFRPKAGRLRIRLGVSEEGRASSCHVQNDVSAPEFKEAACDLLLDNARFEPALDAAGNPLESYYLLLIIYQMGQMR